MEIELDIKEITLEDLNYGDWFVPFGSIVFNKKSSVWMVIDVPQTLFIGNQSATRHRVVVKVAHVYIPDLPIRSVIDKKSIIPIGVVTELPNNTPVVPLDHDKIVTKLQEKKLDND